MPARLKVFTWSDGFHAFTVAASSRPKALAAWGVSQDLFKTGLAHELDEGADYNAALESPGEVIERGLAVDVGKAVKAKKPKLKGPSPAARKKVKTLEADLDALDARHAEALEALGDKVKEAEAALEKARHDQAAERKALAARLKKAREAL